MVSVEELEALLAGDHELRGLEVKGAGRVRNNGRFVAKVARAVMAMGNLRDGGLVVIGIADDRIAAMGPGLDATEVAEWTDFDLVSAGLGQYSDPPVSFELHSFTLSSGAGVVVLEVAEFDQDIHICRKDFEGVLQSGQTYVRPRGMPRSVQVPSSAEARELHTLAIDKGVREFIRRAGAAGIGLGPAMAPADADRAAYDAESERAWAAPTPVTEPRTGALVQSVATPGFTDVAVRPGGYRADRLRPGELERFVVEHTVSMRGWPVPFVSQREPVQRHGRWVAQNFESGGVPHGEAWRMFTSGQFLHRRLFTTDLSDAPHLRADVEGATGAVAVWDVLLYMVEVAEFAARMATTLAVDQVTFEIGLAGIAGRELISGDPRRELHGPHVAGADRFDATLTVDVAALLEDPRGTGVSLAQALLQQFGLDVPDQVLFDYQEQVFNRR